MDERRSNSGSLQAGVYGTSTTVTAGGVAGVAAADFMVTQRAAGANMSVDVNMPAGGFAYVQGTTINGQGLYTVPVHSVNINELIAGADATNPRVDSVILEIQDNVLDASGGNLARTRVLTGTPTAATTLSSRAGAPALPGNALLLADLLVPAAASTVPNSNIRDRRKWARGAFIRIPRSSGDYVTTSTTLVLIDSTNLQPRLECSGSPMKMRLEANWGISASPFQAGFDLGIDGVAQGIRKFDLTTSGNGTKAELEWDFIPSAGSHLIGPMYANNQAGTLTLAANTTSFEPLTLAIEEVVRQNSQNNTVTSG